MNEKKIFYSVLDLATVPEGYTASDALANTLKLAQETEALGYTRYWIAEHHNMDAIASNAPAIIITHVAQGTKRIKVGSGGVMLPNHAPLIVAEQFGTLGRLHPGRIDLGLGRAPGTDQETARAIRSDFILAAHSFPEDVKQIQQYFSGDNKISKVRAPIAEGVEVPIYILGSSTDSAHLAAKMGLPYAFASHFATAQLMPALKIYREEFKPSGELKAPYVIVSINVFVAENDEEAQKLSTSFLHMIIGLVTGKRRDALQKPGEMTTQLNEVSQHPAIQQMIRYSFTGSKETVKKQLADFLLETNADELIVVSHIHDVQDKIKSYALFSEIMQEINA